MPASAAIGNCRQPAHLLWLAPNRGSRVNVSGWWHSRPSCSSHSVPANSGDAFSSFGSSGSFRLEEGRRRERRRGNLQKTDPLCKAILMRRMRSELPSPNWLVTFEAAARCLSFTTAAAELNVTRVAVSQQIKSLEAFLGTQLFHRLHRSLRLTRAGENYYRAISASLQSMLSATQEVRRSREKRSVTITTSTGFATYWLLQRIGQIRALHPELELQFFISDNYVDLEANEIDVAVRYGDGEWPGLTAKFLLQERIFPVCSRSYLLNRAPLRRPEDLLLEKLLHLEGRYDPQTRWLSWFREHGVDIEEPPQGLRFNTYTNLVQAALDGQGVALIGPPLMQKFLDAGTLLHAIEVGPVMRRAFYLVLPKDREPTAATALFCAWIEQASLPAD